MKLKHVGGILAGLFALCFNSLSHAQEIPYIPSFYDSITAAITDESNAPDYRHYLSGPFGGVYWAPRNIMKYKPNSTRTAWEVDTTFLAPSGIAFADSLTFDTTQGNKVLVASGGDLTSTVRLNASDGSYRLQAPTVYLSTGEGLLPNSYWSPNISHTTNRGGNQLYYCIPGVTGWLPFYESTYCPGTGDVPFYLATLVGADEDANASDPVGRLQVNYTLYYAGRY